MALTPKANAPDTKKPKEEKRASGFVFGNEYDNMSKEVEDANAQTLTLFPEYIIKDGVNVLMIMPGMQSSGGHPVTTKMCHGYNNHSCARSNRSDRFETCPKCDYWFKNRSTKEEKDRKQERPADAISPNTKGIFQIVDYTWAVEHEKISKGEATIERAIGTEIDMDKVKERPCFMNEEKFDATSDKCKACPAFKACFQGPQFLLISGERTKDLLREMGRIARNKTIKIGKKELSLRGNISMAWWTLNPIAADGSEEGIAKAKSIAKMVAFPLIITKTQDPKKDKRYGTKYDVTFEKGCRFVIPAKHQTAALSRARDLGDYAKSGSPEDVKKEFDAWLATISATGKPACFDDSAIKDSDECMGESCSAYKDCCAKKSDKNKDKKGDGKTKQKERTTSIMDDDDDDDEEVENLMKHMGVDKDSKKKGKKDEDDDDDSNESDDDDDTDDSDDEDDDDNLFDDDDSDDDEEEEEEIKPNKKKGKK